MSDLRGFGQNLLRGFREVVDEGRARFGPLGENLLRDTERQFRTNPAGFIPPHAQQAMGNAAQALEFTDAGDVKAYQDTTSAALDAVARGSWADAAMNAPGVAASMASLMLPGFGFGGAIKAYHGSPYDFDKFDAAKIGTGEGAQAYGHGLYFAENEDVARAYRASSSKSAKFKYDGVPVTDELENSVAWYLTQANGDKGAVVEKWRQMYKPRYFESGPGAQELKILEEMDYGKLDSGRMYEVNIDAEPEQFLDWDAAFKKQPEAVKELARQELKAKGYLGPNDNGPRQLDSALKAWRMAEGGMSDTPIQALLFGKGDIAGGTPEAVASKLREAGVPGIRYLDQGSRGVGKGTRNYVVFDPNQVEIKKKY